MLNPVLKEGKVRRWLQFFFSFLFFFFSIFFLTFRQFLLSQMCRSSFQSRLPGCFLSACGSSESNRKQSTGKFLHQAKKLEILLVKQSFTVSELFLHSREINCSLAIYKAIYAQNISYKTSEREYINFCR